jgi:hypothetical protein
LAALICLTSDFLLTFFLTAGTCPGKTRAKTSIGGGPSMMLLADGVIPAANPPSGQSVGRGTSRMTTDGGPAS